MNKHKRGFTAVEVIIVIIVIGILSTMGIMSFTKYRATARDTQRQSQLTAISSALEKYFEQNGEYPGCSSLTQNPSSITTNVLVGVDPTIFVAPGSGLTNSVLCQTPTSSDYFAYVGDTSSTCTTGSACASYQLQYKSEADGSIVTISSVNSADISTAGTITLNSIPAPDCTTGFTNLSASWNSLSGAASYTVQRDTSNTFLVSSPGFAESTPTTNSTTLSGLSSATQYYVRVRANDSSGKYTYWSNVVNQTTKDNSITLSATAATFSVNLSWTANTCAYQYTLQRATDSGFTQNLVENTYASGTTTATASSLTGGTTYYFRIRMITAASGGYTSPWSSTVSAVPLSSPPAAPIMAYISTGVFEISNTITSDVTYNTALVSGSGTATASTVNNKIRYTLSSTTARFSITAQWTAGGSPSAADYMERKPYSYTPDTRYSCTVCGNPYGCWKSCGCECSGGGCGCYGNSGASWGQCGCPGNMCWYNWGTCQDCYQTTCGSAPTLIDETANGYTNSGTEWYKLY